jgi:hypothetical protein
MYGPEIKARAKKSGATKGRPAEYLHTLIVEYKERGKDFDLPTIVYGRQPSRSLVAKKACCSSHRRNIFLILKNQHSAISCTWFNGVCEMPMASSTR